MYVYKCAKLICSSQQLRRIQCTVQISGHIEVLRIGEPIAEMDLVDMESWSPNEVVLFLAGEVPDIDENVLKSFADNKVSGDLLLDLDDDSLRELILVLGDRIRVKKAIARVKASSGVCVTVIIVSRSRPHPPKATGRVWSTVI